MQTVYTPWIWDFRTGGTYVVQQDTGAGSQTKVVVRISDNWGSTDLGSDAIVRVTASYPNGDGAVLGDIIVNRYGSFLSAPAGWTFGSGGLQRVLSNWTLAQAPYPYTGGIGSTAPTAFDPIGPTYNPPATSLTDWRNQVNGLYSSTVSDPLVIFAYEINPSYSGNPPGWKPDYFVYGWAEQQPLGDIGARPGGRPIDNQMQTIFCTARKVDVSQSDYGVVGKSAIRNPVTGITAGVYPDTLANTDAEIYIIISPGGCIDNTPVYNPGTMPNTPNLNTGGQTITINFVPKPPIDDSGGGGKRPVIFPTPGGGGTPAGDSYIALEVTPDPILHANTDVNTFKTKSFTIKNIGTVTVDVDEVVNTHPDNIFPFAMVSPIAFPFTIEPEEEFAGTSYFLPNAAITYTELGYVKKEANILRSFSISGTGTASGNPGTTPLRKIALFGDVATSGDRNFLEVTIGDSATTNVTAVNAGTLPITLSSVSLGGAGVFTTPGITAGFILAVGAEKDIPVTFTPVGAQPYVGTFTLNSDAQASDQAGFNPATGAITSNLLGTGSPEELITRIMQFNVENNGTFEDVLAGGSATAELDATITNIGNGTLRIDAFQVEGPFTLDVSPLESFTTGLSGFYYLDAPYYLGPSETSPIFKISFTPPTATNYVDDVYVDSNKTSGPEAFEVRGLGLYVPEEPEEPNIPITPDDEPPPGQEFDPGTVPSSDLDGNGASCIPKECDVTYVYEYSSNGEIVT